MVEHGAAGREAVDVRRFDVGSRVAEVAKAEVVRDDEEDVRRRGGRVGARGGGGECESSEEHDSKIPRGAREERSLRATRLLRTQDPASPAPAQFAECEEKSAAV